MHVLEHIKKGGAIKKSLLIKAIPFIWGGDRSECLALGLTISLGLLIDIIYIEPDLIWPVPILSLSQTQFIYCYSTPIER